MPSEGSNPSLTATPYKAFPNKGLRRNYGPEVPRFPTVFITGSPAPLEPVDRLEPRSRRSRAIATLLLDHKISATRLVFFRAPADGKTTISSPRKTADVLPRVLPWGREK